MDEAQIQEWVDQITTALEGLAPEPPPGPGILGVVAALSPIVALIAAIVAAVIGWKNLKAQQRALMATQRNHARTIVEQRKALDAAQRNHDTSLDQKREADARSEWWRRTQWALDAAAHPDTFEVGIAMLNVQAESALAGDEELAVIESVLNTVLPSRLDDEGIDQVVEEAQQAGLAEDLSPEEEAALARYYDVDDSDTSGDNEGDEEGTT